jgi:hypothetical protein
MGPFSKGRVLRFPSGFRIGVSFSVLESITGAGVEKPIPKFFTGKNRRKAKERYFILKEGLRLFRAHPRHLTSPGVDAIILHVNASNINVTNWGATHSLAKRAERIQGN